MKKKNKNIKEGGPIRKFWNYLWYDDSIGSYVLNFIVAFIFIKYIFFPGLGFILNNDYPVVAIVSGSMEHKFAPKSDSYGRPELNPDNTYTYFLCTQTYSEDKKFINFDKKVDLDEFWDVCGDYYETNFNITQDMFSEFRFNKGLNIGDVMILYGKKPENIEIGEVLVFKPQSEAFFNNYGPVIHRVVDKWEEDGEIFFRTKGDHNGESFENFENKISEDDVFGVGVVRIPYIGYAKLLFTRAYLGVTDFVSG
jgi:hypothetical protein